MEVLREAPQITSFVPLVEHQSTTPASFYTGPPVLHYYSDRSKLIVLEHEVKDVPAFAVLLEKAVPNVHSNGTETNGDSDAQQDERVIEEVDVWVTSEKLLLYSHSASAGISIPYPSISLHAIQSLPQPSSLEQQGLYMQIISPEEQSEEDLEPESLSVTVIPTASAPPATDAVEDPIESEAKPEVTPVLAMFTALSNCSNLHPDPVDPNDEDIDGEGSRLIAAGLALPGTTDGGMPPAMPGSGGWITAENMHEFVDDDGNWIGGDDDDLQNDEQENTASQEALGPGAGRVRPREEDEHGASAADGDETKWRRTD